MLRSIASRDNPWFRRFRKAAERHEDEIVIEGRKAIADCVARGVEIVALAGSSEEELSLFDSAAPRLVLSDSLLATLADARTPQSVLALARRPHTSNGADLPTRHGRLVVLDGVQDPGNVGTLIRLAAAFWCDAVITTPGCADPYSPRSLRAAVGTTWHLPVLERTREEVLAVASAHDLVLLAADGRADRTVGHAVLPSRFALILGSEGQGVSDFFRGAAQGVRIELDPGVESLNVAAAAAIILYESSRRRERHDVIPDPPAHRE